MSSPSSRRLRWSSLLALSLAACGGMSQGHRPPADAGIATAGDCAAPQIWFLDLDGDQYGDNSVSVTACQAPQGYVAQGGDCNDYDPLRHPGAPADPGFVFDRCGKGQPIEPMNAKADWTPSFSAPSGGEATMVEEAGACLGGNRLALHYTLPELSNCGTSACAWATMRKVLPTPADVSGQDYLLFPFQGDPNDPNFRIDFRLEDSGGCRVDWPLSDIANLPARRSAVIPLKWFSTPGPGRDCSLDLTKVKAMEIGIYGEAPAEGVGKHAGVLHLDAITALKASELRLAPTFFACPSNQDYGARGRIIGDLLKRHKDSLGKHSHPFVPRWFEEPPSRYRLYDQALLLLVFTLDAAVWGNEEARAAATALATALLDLQGQPSDGAGRWYDFYQDRAEGQGVLPFAQAGSSPGEVAWVIMALDLYRDLVPPTPRQPIDDAIALAANWLQSRIDAQPAAGAGPIAESSETNLASFFALVAAERFERAAALKKAVLASAWKADEQRLWKGPQDPGLALNVMGTWGVEFLRAVGEQDKALAGLGLAAGVFAARSFDGKHAGLADVAGPWQPNLEATGQYLATGGWGGLSLLPDLLSYENDGTFPSAPNDLRGVAGGSTPWHALAPAAWIYLALSPDILARLSLPIFYDDFEAEGAWSVSEETPAPHPECFAKGVGTASRSTEIVVGSAASLCLVANPGLVSPLGNRVLAERQVLDASAKGTVRLEADVVIAKDSHGQGGPELGVHNVRRVGEAFTRSTLAIQYLANPEDPNFGRWALWSDREPGVAGWKIVPGIAAELSPGVWYHVKLIGNFDSNRYSDLIISTQDPASAQPLKAFDLSSHLIFDEPQSAGPEGLVVGVAVENLSNSCGAGKSGEARVCYDNLMIRR